jgi:hypothetical protein
MKRAIFFVSVMVVLAGFSGCANEYGCRDGRHCSGGRAYGGQAYGDPAAAGSVAYPYYQTRGPRDFLDRNPQSIGP